MYLALTGLGEAYSSIGLFWASNNSQIAASSIAFRSWHDSNVLDDRVVYPLEQLCKNELLLGRIPSFLMWHELYLIVIRRLQVDSKQDDMPMPWLLDSCLAVRILTYTEIDNDYSYLPDLLESQTLEITKLCSLYNLGYVEVIKEELQKAGITGESEFQGYFSTISNQPFRGQMQYKTNFVSGQNTVFKSKVLGCVFQVHFDSSTNMFLSAEIILAYIEGFFATSLASAVPSIEIVDIYLIDRMRHGEPFHVETGLSASSYQIYLDSTQFVNESEKCKEKLFQFIALILRKVFYVKEMKEYLDVIFKNEEVLERLELISAHKTFSTNVLGTQPKFFYSSWLSKLPKNYPAKRLEHINYDDQPKGISQDKQKKVDYENLSHSKRNVISIIDVPVWDAAQWRAFGCFGDSRQLNVFLGFLNIRAGKQIFEDWIKRFGKEDLEDQIKITVIRGVDVKNPNWYRIHISSKFSASSFEEGNLYITPSRFHEMNADTPKNLELLLSGFQKLGSYRLCPGQVDMSGRLFPFFDNSITKKSLNVRHAWEIGINDLDSVVIKNTDNPIIPSDKKNAPVLDLIKTKRDLT
jgi:hypothetical protein